LESFDLQEMIPHCLQVLSKVNSAVAVENHKGPSYFKVFPRTLSMILEPVWNQLVEEARNNDEGGGAETENNFILRLKEFIAVHSTSADRHEWLKILRTDKKPRDMGVQAFWYRLRELNKQIEWLPGSEPVLTDDQIKQAFYDAMPETWKDRYVYSGSSFEGSTMAQVVKYFRDQESNANKRQQENEKFQKSKSQGHRHQNGKSEYEKSKSSNTSDSEDDKSDKEDNNKKKQSFNSSPKRSRISDDTPCPIHPGAGHKWSQCRSNAYNKDRLNYKKAKPNNDNQSPASEAKGLRTAEINAITYDDPKDTLYSQDPY
jgi:hypothetical protein